MPATHGQRHTPLYNAWTVAKRRYGMAGGFERFAAFFAAMGPRPAGARLARRDQSQPHGRGNSYWAAGLARAEAQKLRRARGEDRRRLLMELRAAGHTLQALGDALGISRQRVQQIVGQIVG